MPPAERNALEAEAAFALQMKRATQGKTVAISYVPIRPHIIRRSDGTGGYSLKSLNNVMALTNSNYLRNGVGIQFYFSGISPDYIDDDVLYNECRATTDDATIAPNDVPDALNMYMVNKFDRPGLGGYAKFPVTSAIPMKPPVASN